MQQKKKGKKTRYFWTNTTKIPATRNVRNWIIPWMKCNVNVLRRIYWKKVWTDIRELEGKTLFVSSDLKKDLTYWMKNLHLFCNIVKLNDYTCQEKLSGNRFINGFSANFGMINPHMTSNYFYHMRFGVGKISMFLEN